jgi:GNAT superfamily N-acetyltransferase
MPADAGFTLAVQTGFDRAWARGRAGAAELETRWWPSHERLLQAIEPPVAYATLAYGGADVAWGMAVLDGGRLGLFGLVTAAAFRGRGAGRVLLGGLLDWGKQAGAGSSWLQVTEANDAAVRLYRAAGFSDLYRYEYWQRERG